MTPNFTTPCFIMANNPELRAKLEELGYKNYGNPFQSTDDSRIYTTIDGYYVPYMVRDIDNSWYDCGTNEQLFLALAALRDDTDKNQFFVLNDDSDIEKNPDDEPYLCNTDSVTDSILCYDLLWGEYHKATPEELIKYFTK